MLVMRRSATPPPARHIPTPLTWKGWTPVTSTELSTAPKIESEDLNLNKLFQDFYSVPDYQREYVWEPENVEALLKDVCDEFYDEGNRLNPGPEYFIGSIVVCQDDGG